MDAEAGKSGTGVSIEQTKRGSPPSPPFSVAFTSLTATLALFDIPPLCSAALQIPLSHLHSLKAHFHLSLCLFFFLSFPFFLLFLQIGLFCPWLLFWREPYSLSTTQPIPTLPESVIKHIGPNTQAITRALMFHLHTAGTMVSLYKQPCCCSQ